MGHPPMEAALDVMDPDFRYKSALVLSQQRFIKPWCLLLNETTT